MVEGWTLVLAGATRDGGEGPEADALGEGVRVCHSSLNRNVSDTPLTDTWENIPASA